MEELKPDCDNCMVRLLNKDKPKEFAEICLNCARLLTIQLEEIEEGN